MSGKIKLFVLGLIILSLCVFVPAQKKDKKGNSTANAVMWSQVDISQRDLFLGPGGTEMRPDLSSVTYVKEKKGGHSKKYEVKDGLGRTYIAKIGDEAQSETAATRLLWALGYKTEVNYLVPKLNIIGKGVFTNVRLEARPDNVKRGDDWSWNNNPFKNTKEFQALKIMMAFLNNWDLKTDNNVIIQEVGTDNKYYIISDLGVSFGKLGSNPLPIFWRIGRSRNNPEHYSKSKFVKDSSSTKLKVHYRGKSSGIFDSVTIDHGRWLANLLLKLSDRQIEDAFRAANYSDNNVRLLTQSVKKRIKDLDRVTNEGIARK